MKIFEQSVSDFRVDDNLSGYSVHFDGFVPQISDDCSEQHLYFVTNQSRY